MNANGRVYETFGNSKRFPVKPLRCLLNVTPLKLALSAKCFIYRVQATPPQASGNFFIHFFIKNNYFSVCIT